MYEDNVDLQDMLRAVTNAGASGAYVACVATEAPGAGPHLPRRHAARCEGTGERPAVGDFAAALWDGDVEAAWAHADRRNRRLMRAAGVVDETADVFEAAP